MILPLTVSDNHIIFAFHYRDDGDKHIISTYHDAYDGQVSHTLEEESPLFNFTPGQLLKAKMELIVCLEVIFTMIIIILDTIAISLYFD